MHTDIRNWGEPNLKSNKIAEQYNNFTQARPGNTNGKNKTKLPDTPVPL